MSIASQLDNMDSAMRYELRNLSAANRLAYEACLTDAHPLMQSFLSDRIKRITYYINEIEAERQILRAELR
jgi:hypothetical protein